MSTVSSRSRLIPGCRFAPATWSPPQQDRAHLSSRTPGLLVGKDSTKEKRYAQGGRAGEVEKAFGFSLALLLARSAEIEALAAQRLNEHI